MSEHGKGILVVLKPVQSPPFTLSLNQRHCSCCSSSPWGLGGAEDGYPRAEPQIITAGPCDAVQPDRAGNAPTAEPEENRIIQGNGSLGL